MSTAANGALDGIRVLDLTTTRGELAGRVLAELGAEVIKLEPSDGAEARGRGPYLEGREGDPEASLYWASVGASKRSLVLDPSTAEGAEALRRWVRNADVLIESYAPGVMAEHGLGYDDLVELAPQLVYVSISPFGQTGPRAHAPANDFTVEASGGLIGLQGDRDRPPIGAGIPQAFFHAGVQAASDTVIALLERERSGRGQHLDVSAQAAIVWTLMNASGYPPVTDHNPPGTSEFRSDPLPEIVPGLRVPTLMACADGLALVSFGLPVVGEASMHAMLRVIEQAGQLPQPLAGQEWTGWIRDLVEGRRTVDQMKDAFAAIEAFLASQSKHTLMGYAVEHRILIAPILNAADLLVDPQLTSREFFVKVGELTHPGPFARLSETPVDTRPAPALDEARGTLEPERPERVFPMPKDGNAEGALAGVKVADFAWVGVGPIISKALADHGATVIHVESEARLDVLRQLPPFEDDRPGINRSQFMANFNTSKRGIALDMRTDAGLSIAKRLAGWADVVVESFTPGTVKKLGLDYATLTRERKDLVMLSTCLRGQTGPQATYGGFGTQGAALAGLFSVTGWPDRAPAGTWGAYTDFIAPRYATAALMSALYYRNRTGIGQYIDVSQIEAATHFMEPLLLDHTANGRLPGGVGHDSPLACPNGTYATQGHERYLAISVETDVQFAALCEQLSLRDFSELEGLDARIGKRRELEAAVAAQCREQDAFALADRLLAAGVPAYAVMRPSDLYEDPQLAHRGFFVTLDHAEMGPTPYDGLVTQFSRTPGRLRRPAPILGEHTFEVLSDVLNLDEEEITQAAIAGALT